MEAKNFQNESIIIDRRPVLDDDHYLTSVRIKDTGVELFLSEPAGDSERCGFGDLRLFKRAEETRSRFDYEVEHVIVERVRDLMSSQGVSIEIDDDRNCFSFKNDDATRAIFEQSLQEVFEVESLQSILISARRRLVFGTQRPSGEELLDQIVSRNLLFGGEGAPIQLTDDQRAYLSDPKNRKAAVKALDEFLGQGRTTPPRP